MNVGQVLELHLGWVAKAGWKLEGNEPWQENLRAIGAAEQAPNGKVATPVFDGAREEELIGLSDQHSSNKDAHAVDRVQTVRLNSSMVVPVSLVWPQSQLVTCIS
jgi:DNA-directed RNA polymerase beta subunit